MVAGIEIALDLYSFSSIKGHYTDHFTFTNIWSTLSSYLQNWTTSAQLSVTVLLTDLIFALTDDI